MTRKTYGLPTFDCWPSESAVKADGPYSYVCIVGGPTTIDTRAEGEEERSWMDAAGWLDAMEEQGDWSRPVSA